MEDTLHILDFQSHGAKLTWEASVARLKECLESSNSCPALRKLVLNIVGNFNARKEIILGEDYAFDGVDTLFQNKIDSGWRLFLDGFLSHE